MDLGVFVKNITWSFSRAGDVNCGSEAQHLPCLQYWFPWAEKCKQGRLRAWLLCVLNTAWEQTFCSIELLRSLTNNRGVVCVLRFGFGHRIRKDSDSKKLGLFYPCQKYSRENRCQKSQPMNFRPIIINYVALTQKKACTSQNIEARFLVLKEVSKAWFLHEAARLSLVFAQ